MQQIAQSTSSITIKAYIQPLILLTHFPKPIISAKWGSRKRSGSQKSHKLIIQSIAFVASNLKILPEPLDSLAREFWAAGGGTGGGKGPKNWCKTAFGGGGGGGGGGGISGRREKVGFWVALVVSSGLALWVVLEKEDKKENDLIFWVFVVVSVFAVCLFLKGWRREIKDWVFGFSCGAALMGLGLWNNQDFVRLVDKFRVSSSNVWGISKKRRKGRRWI